jgi:hypothetical protein
MQTAGSKKRFTLAQVLIGALLWTALIVVAMFVVNSYRNSSETHHVATTYPAYPTYPVQPPTPAPAPVPQPPQVISPGQDADIESVLDYLQKRGRALNGTAWSEDAGRVLEDEVGWERVNVNPPRFIYPRGIQTTETFEIEFDPSVNKWNLHADRDFVPYSNYPNYSHYSPTVSDIELWYPHHRRYHH